MLLFLFKSLVLFYPCSVIAVLPFFVCLFCVWSIISFLIILCCYFITLQILKVFILHLVFILHSTVCLFECVNANTCLNVFAKKKKKRTSCRRFNQQHIRALNRSLVRDVFLSLFWSRKNWKEKNGERGNKREASGVSSAMNASGKY